MWRDMDTEEWRMYCGFHLPVAGALFSFSAGGGAGTPTGGGGSGGGGGSAADVGRSGGGGAPDRSTIYKKRQTQN